MAPAWSKLSTAFKDHRDVVVAKVDCTGAGQELCSQHGVRGFPTIKWGSADDLEDYEGNRDYDSLKAFAEKLGLYPLPVCGPRNLALCDEATKARIAELQALSPEALDAKIAEQESRIQAADEKFKDEVQKLQSRYSELSSEK